MQNLNKPLFSSHYLEFYLPESREWKLDPSPVFEQLKSLYLAKKKFLSHWNEAQTEEELIKPILTILGFSYIPQVITKGKGRTERPDYALFANDHQKLAAYSDQDNESVFYQQALAIAEAKYWERPLSKVSSNDQRDIYKNTNPSFQITSYLIGTGVNWGILTNGREWRLYSRLASSINDELYSVDLVELLEGQDLERFKYFWLFFRREAFEKDSQGQNFLERVRDGSATYATRVGNELKSLVFEQIFSRLAGGFVADLTRRGHEVNENQVYEATLSFLYKLLFLFYAEARNLLPIQGSYRAYSLTAIAQDIAEGIKRGQVWSQSLSKVYDDLIGLFQIIDRGDAGLEVPRYNGGLFHFEESNNNINPDFESNHFLKKYRLPDAVLVPVIDKLARFEGQAIDYSFLGVRQLGSIYEGLLEYRLIIDNPATGEVHLENDKGERKASGSYYTPDYIVKYIVSHTLKPILETREQQFNDLMAQIGELQRQKNDKRLGLESLRDVDRQLRHLARQAQTVLLDIKVCDPAMGSGHFLVEAVDFLKNQLILILNRYPDHNPILMMLDQMRQSIIENLSSQGIQLEPSRLEPTQLLQRVVMKRCVYGVDLNPMAVELAKVSLWLHSFTIGAPLSFLDHHLRCGNSLIGTTAREAELAMSQEKNGNAVQFTLLTGPFVGLLRAAEIMRGVSVLSDATFAEVEESERLFKQFDSAAKPFKQLLDVYVSQFFGVKQAKNLLARLGKNLINPDTNKMSKADLQVLEDARKLYEEKHFFHWDLEFPEVFIDLENANWAENPGFDAVIANPPYINVLNIEFQERDYLLKNYEFAQGRVDIYIPLFEKILNILKTKGIFGVITPNKYFVYSYGSILRKKLLEETTILNLVDLARAESIFPEAATYTVISIVSKQIPNNEHLIDSSIFIEDRPSEILSLSTAKYNNFCIQEFIPQSRFLKTPVNVFSLWLYDVRWNIYEKIDKSSELLINDWHIEQCIRIGSKKLRNELILISPNSIPKSAKPIIDADEVERYSVNWQQRCLIYDKKKLYNAKSEELFEQRKIFVKDTSTDLTVALDLGQDSFYYALNTVYVIISNNNSEINISFLATILNSPISDFLYKLLFGALTISGGYVRFREYLQYLPIRKINFTTKGDRRQQGLENLINLYQLYQTNFDPAPILDQCQHHLDQDPEEADIIHDFLAYLAEQMLELNRQKQTEVKGFLDWLASFIGCPITNLKNKTKIQNYLGDYTKQASLEPALDLDGLITILNQNKKSIKIDPSSRQDHTRLQTEYQNSLNILLPLKTQLKHCDQLIDEIVYPLYGLTPEEKAIIEGSLKSH